MNDQKPCKHGLRIPCATCTIADLEAKLEAAYEQLSEVVVEGTAEDIDGHMIPIMRGSPNLPAFIASLQKEADDVAQHWGRELKECRAKLEAVERDLKNTTNESIEIIHDYAAKLEAAEEKLGGTALERDVLISQVSTLQRERDRLREAARAVISTWEVGYEGVEEGLAELRAALDASEPEQL